MTPALTAQEELLLRLIASWGGFGWERVADRYDAIMPPQGRPDVYAPGKILTLLAIRGCVESAPAESGPDGEPLLTTQGRAFIAERNRAKALGALTTAAVGGPSVHALISLAEAMAPQACEFFEAAEYDSDIERISVALDVAAAAIGVDLNPRTHEDERAGLEGGA